MNTVKTKFSAGIDGFRFPNRFEIHLPIQYPLPLVGVVNLNDVVFGLCGGMSFAALDYFHAQAALPLTTEVAALDPKLFIYLCDRQLDSLKISVLVKIIEWMLLEDKELARRIARVEAPRLLKSLDSGEPAVLLLIRVQGFDNPTHNHQVVATGYELDPVTKDYRITLYDPNHPGEEPELTFNLSRPSAGIRLAQSTGEGLRGFFTIPYKTSPVVPGVAAAQAGLALRAAPAAAGAEPEFRLRWPVDSRRVNQFFGENPASYRPFGLPGHEGIDLFAISGANVYAAADGDVYQAGHPANHPYGLHVRIRHERNGRVYHTVYAHLSQLSVKSGGQVSAGDLVGLADNTGNSFGSHLHLTLKIEGQQTPGYPAGIVDPWPYLQGSSAEPKEPLPPPSGVTVYTTGQVNLRSAPDLQSQVVTILPAGEGLSVLGAAAQATPKIGAEGEWLQVITASAEDGFVAAWLVRTLDQAFPPSDLVIYPFDAVNLRAGPGTGFNMLASLSLDDPLTVLGSADNARAKLGQAGEWIQVQTEAGMRGFVAAWLVHATGQNAPASGLTLYPTDVVNIRARPALDGNVLTTVTPQDALTVLGDQGAAASKVGGQDQWINVQTPQKYTGYVAAWLVQSAAPAPTPPPLSVLTVYPTAPINLRAQPSVNSPRINGANFNEPLKVVDPDLNSAQVKIGQMDQWVYIEKQDGNRGWAAAWLVGKKPA